MGGVDLPRVEGWTYRAQHHEFVKRRKVEVRVAEAVGVVEVGRNDWRQSRRRHKGSAGSGDEENKGELKGH